MFCDEVIHVVLHDCVTLRLKRQHAAGIADGPFFLCVPLTSQYYDSINSPTYTHNIRVVIPLMIVCVQFA